MKLRGWHCDKADLLLGPISCCVSIYTDGSGRIYWLSKLPLHSTRWWKCTTLTVCQPPKKEGGKVEGKKRRKRNWNTSINNEVDEMVAVFLFAVCMHSSNGDEWVKMTRTWRGHWHGRTTSSPVLLLITLHQVNITSHPAVFQGWAEVPNQR